MTEQQMREKLSRLSKRMKSEMIQHPRYSNILSCLERVKQSTEDMKEITDNPELLGRLINAVDTARAQNMQMAQLKENIVKIGEEAVKIFDMIYETAKEIL